jgi:hypothetical protein
MADTKHKLLRCKLARHHRTDEGDYVPQGTPVTVLGWAPSKGTGCGYGAKAKLTVRVEAYVYVGEVPEDPDKLEKFEKLGGQTNGGLYVDVAQEQLEFLSYEEGDK